MLPVLVFMADGWWQGCDWAYQLRLGQCQRQRAHLGDDRDRYRGSARSRLCKIYPPSPWC